jgi:hypothetical protein
MRKPNLLIDKHGEPTMIGCGFSFAVLILVALVIKIGWDWLLDTFSPTMAALLGLATIFGPGAVLIFLSRESRQDPLTWQLLGLLVVIAGASAIAISVFVP